MIQEIQEIIQLDLSKVPKWKWKQSLYHSKCENVYQLFEESRKQFIKRMKEIRRWKKTRDYSVYKKPLKEIKQKYSKVFLSFLKHPEASSMKEQNKILGGFSMRSSMVSLGIIPKANGSLEIHQKYR